MTFALSTPELDDTVLPESRTIWSQVKKQWFVIDETCPYQQREPGLLKDWFDKTFDQIYLYTYISLYLLVTKCYKK